MKGARLLADNIKEVFTVSAYTRPELVPSVIDPEVYQPNPTVLVHCPHCKVVITDKLTHDKKYKCACKAKIKLWGDHEMKVTIGQADLDPKPWPVEPE